VTGRCLPGPRLAVLRHRSRIRVFALSGAIAIALGACQEPPATADRAERAKLDNGQVALVAVAPDGTKLWAVRANRIVYFSSAGTQTHHVENCGKNCWRTIDDDAVPAASISTPREPGPAQQAPGSNHGD
jgi:hypothetical protein